MSGGDIAGLIAAGVFALLVLLLAVPILKLGRVFDEVRTSIRSISARSLPAFRGCPPSTLHTKKPAALATGSFGYAAGI